MNIYFVSLGCPKNLTDTEVLMGQFAAAGSKIVTDPAKADVIIVNTCAFLKSARDEAQAVIREMARYKKKLYIAGCLPKLQASLPKEVDGVIDSIGLFDYCTPRIKATPPWYAYVKIAEGCDNCCSYCLIPRIRGKLRVRPAKDILKEVELLAKRGVKEIIYVAQDTTAYPQFARLLKRTAKISGIRWIRIMYAHPEHLTEGIIRTIAAEKKIVKYLDLPVQHASDRILKKMNRRYKKADVESLINKLRAAIPSLVIRTSLIVGFPGETAADFNELLDFVRRMKFDRLGVFPYFRETGTPAAKLKGQVPSKIKRERARRLMQLQARISKERNRSLIGRTLDVLVEGKCFGRSYRDAPEIDGKVILKGRSFKPGQFIRARVIKARTYDLLALPC